MSRTALIALRDQETRQPVDAAIAGFAARLATAHGPSVAAVLFYGSGLWKGLEADSVLDFYLLVDAYRPALGSRRAAWANALLPPNVFYRETEIDGVMRRCKYAVFTLRQFHRAAGLDAWSPQIWARFAQPCRLVWVRDDTARASSLEALARSAETLHHRYLPILETATPIAEFWAGALRHTYGMELRTEGAARPQALLAAAPDHYHAITRAVIGLAPEAQTVPATASRWRRRAAKARLMLMRPTSKLLTMLRLMKATVTFDGAVDYALWKIERHSGIRIAPTAFMRRWPLLAAWGVLWRLYRAGALH